MFISKQTFEGITTTGNNYFLCYILSETNLSEIAGLQTCGVNNPGHPFLIHAAINLDYVDKRNTESWLIASQASK